MLAALPVRLGLVLLLALVGCGGVNVEQGSSDLAPEPVDRAALAAASENLDLDKARRRIVHEADVEIRVEDFDGIPDRVTKLVARHDGFVKASGLGGVSGDSRTGSWTLRIPVTGYEAFLEEVRAIGELQGFSTSSNEVTGEFYDVEARLRNKRTEEQRLLEHLHHKADRLEQVLVVEKELNRVREEVERLEGRMRVLEDLTALSTVRLQIRERRDFVPAAAPTFGTRIARSFENSLANLVALGQTLAIAAVALAPWLPVLAVGLGLVWLARTRLRRQSA